MPPFPLPLEGHETPGPGMIAQTPGQGSVPLSLLMEFIIQRTYHELAILADLLPRKTDMERKVEIVQFATRTRKLFVRLLALVKWAASVSKVERCAAITAFLDKQSLLFIETADILHRMSKETLSQARLPNFHIPAAVEVLTLGTYLRLPTCIRDRIIPQDPITPEEKRQTLHQLNQIIQHRLVTTELPAQMRDAKIENGRVRLVVEHEFEVSLTLMGDGPDIPWTLLDIEIMVEDKETGDGKALVHSLQIQYIHQVLQARLINHPRPLVELYMCMHAFCQSLQLEVLHTQAQRLCQERLGDFITIDEYVTGKCLTISYWKELATKYSSSQLKQGYKLTVQADPNDCARPLVVVHIPALTCQEAEIADRTIHSDDLSIERLLVHTIHVRSKLRLSELKQEFQARVGPEVDCLLHGLPAVLSVPVLNPCLRSEHLLISVDTHGGVLLVHVPQFENPLTSEIQQCLNGDRTRLDFLLSELRFSIVMCRIQKTLEHVPASVHEKLPLLYSQNHRMHKLGRHKVFITLHKYPSCILVVEVEGKESCPCEMSYKYFLVFVKPCSIEDDPKDDTVETELPKMYLRVLSMVELDSFITIHGPCTRVDVGDIHERVLSSARKRPHLTGSRHDMPLAKRSKHGAYFIPQIAHVVALCDERLAFSSLAHELTKKGLTHQGIQVEGKGYCLWLPIMQLPRIPGVSSDTHAQLEKSLISMRIRMQCRNVRTWVAECLFVDPPIATTCSREKTPTRIIYFQYDVLPIEQMYHTVDLLISDWSQVAHLYEVVFNLARYLQTENYSTGDIISVKSYSYRKLTIAYGPQFGCLLSVFWHPHEKQFQLHFGTSGACGTSNPHIIVASELQSYFNRDRNLAAVCHILHETYTPLSSVSKLPTVPQLGILHSRPQVPIPMFAIIPQTPFHIRIVYCGMHCLDVLFRGEGLVAVRDGAHSRFNRSRLVEELSPAPGLKTFLSKYVDESALLHHHAQSEDDNPPSPISASDAVASSAQGGGVSADFLSHPPKPGSPAVKDTAGSGLRFGSQSSGATVGSNPHTPASPHTGTLSQSSQHHSSPATSFSLASPPSLGPQTVNPSPSMLPHPSPSSLLNPSSSPSPFPHAPSPSSFLHPSPSPHAPVSQSPASSLLGPQASPASAPPHWPASPSMPRPSPARPGQSPGGSLIPSVNTSSPQSCGTHISRMLPQRSWAGAVPTLLSHEAFDALCTPCSIVEGGHERKDKLTPQTSPCAPVTSFLAATMLKNHFRRVLQCEKDAFTVLLPADPGILLFKVETLQCRLSLEHRDQMLSQLILKVSPTPEHMDTWMAEDLQAIEEFFNLKIGSRCHLSHPNAVQAFCNILAAPLTILKDCVQVIRLELSPIAPGAKWSLEWCLTTPPSAPPIAPAGMTATILTRNKMLFYIQLTRLGIQLPPNQEPQTVVIPVIYDIAGNTTNMADRRDTTSSTSAIINSSLKRFSDYGGLQHGECSLFPSIRELVNNLVLPMSDGSSGGGGNISVSQAMGPPFTGPGIPQHSQGQPQ
ncbi:unnamed protein product [Darwinula stevensoni]|uniref:Mediator of RNA polymerase II transcription subunit 14 n=1 Tax=Darwinula stevensoni TaxID=69355 RepID=A0A7R8XH26_9CRUS|nr:unnamed protein product [Darwinula stevensoni]CAG0893105.1 unnamed protein product [Darwinula stevensoni]